MSARQPPGEPEQPPGESELTPGEPELTPGGPERAAGDLHRTAGAVGAGGAADPVTITVCPDGPLLVRGNYQLLDGEDRPIDPGRATVALCRCGASSIKPFCDGSHKRTRFRAR